MKIKINEKNAQKIHTALDYINGRRTAFTIRSSSEIEYIAQNAEERLYVLPIKERTGAIVFYTPQGPWANAYGYSAHSTRIKIERKPTGWFLTDVKEATVYPKQKKQIDIYLTQVQADEIQRRSLFDYKIQN